jgi:hypothetical protein
LKANQLPSASELEGAFPLEEKQKALDKAKRAVEKLTGKYLRLVPKEETLLLSRQPIRLEFPAVGQVTATRDGQIQSLDYDPLNQTINPWMDPVELEVHYQTGYPESEIPAILKELVLLIADQFLVKDKARRQHITSLLSIARKLP